MSKVPPTPRNPASQVARDGRERPVAVSEPATAIVDPQRRLLFVNPVLERLLDRRAGQLVGRTDTALTHPEDRAAADAAVAALLGGRAEYIDQPRRFVHRDGSTVPTQARIALLGGADGAPQQLLLQLRDARSDARAAPATDAIEAARAEALDAANRQLQVFSEGIAHDLRAPLRTIEGFSALIAKRVGTGLDETSRDHLERIRNAGQRMDRLLGAIGELARATRARLDCGPVDVSLLADWVIAELADAEPGREVDAHVQPGLVGHGDERLLKLLMRQLLENAWKFSHDRSPVRIDVSGDVGADGLDLRVRDAGRGFDMRYAHKLFEPFQRLHAAQEGAGDGLGLAIAMRIVERHHGRLTGESARGDDRDADGHGSQAAGGPRAGPGSVFHVHLPPPPA